MQLVIPGDTVPKADAYGPGIEDGNSLVAGVYRELNGVSYVDTNTKQYVPAKRDNVIGVIVQRGTDQFKVSLQDHTRPVWLDYLAFENSTRRNRPNLQIGDVVYARVVAANRDTDAAIVCHDPQTGKSAGYGQLKEGNIISVSLGFARHLLFKGHPVLEELGAIYSYELAVGVNGKIWVKGPDNKTTLLICQRLQNENTIYKPSLYTDN